MEYLTDLQKAKIEAFCADKEMYEAVEKVLLAGLYEHGTVQQDRTPNPLQNGAFSLVSQSINNPIPDEMLGQHIRGMWAGINTLKIAFANLNAIKLEKKEAIESPYNEAE